MKGERKHEQQFFFSPHSFENEMSTPYELAARANAVYAKYEKYVIKRPGEGEDDNGRAADGAYGVAYAALLERVNGLMQVRGKKEGGAGRRRTPLSRSLPRPLLHSTCHPPESG